MKSAVEALSTSQLEQSLLRPWRTQAHEEDRQRLFVRVAVGIGIGIAFGIEITVDGHLDADSDSDPETDCSPGISRYHIYFRNI